MIELTKPYLNENEYQILEEQIENYDSYRISINV
jgi:hypothetical protein